MSYNFGSIEMWGQPLTGKLLVPHSSQMIQVKFSDELYPTAEYPKSCPLEPEIVNKYQ